MTFQEYCESKKIDATAFQKGNPTRYEELELLFNEVSPASFTQQKKFIINNIRRSYQLPITEVVKEKVAVKKPAVKTQGVKAKAAKPAIPGAAKPKIPGAKAVIKPKVGGTAKPIIKAKTETATKPVIKPKIPGAKKTALPKPKIPGVAKPAIPKPVIKSKENTEDKPKAKALKPKIPGSKPVLKNTESSTEKPKSSPLKPKIPGAKK